MTYTALITGSSKGIGLELVRQYSHAGWRIFATCRSPENSPELNRLSAATEGRVSVHPLDVTNPKHVQMLASVVGKTPIDLLINNAGTAGQRDASIGNIDESRWLDTIRVNTIAPLMIIEALVNSVAVSQRRVIATLTSQLGSIGANNSGGNYVYRSSKAAVNAVMKSVAVDLQSRGIIAVVLHPGWVRTDMGGAQATFSTEESVAGMRDVLERLTLDDTGKFFNYDGVELPW